MKNYITARIISNAPIARDIYSIWLGCAALAEIAIPGQFVMLYLNASDKLLPRPLGICQVDPGCQAIRLVYKIKGGGTKLISDYKAGDELKLLGPCGNGFMLTAGDDDPQDKPVALIIGGGLGVVPLLLLADRLVAKKIIILGFKTASDIILEKEFADPMLRITTDDGSKGIKGTPLSLLENIEKPNVIYACGPSALLKSIARYAVNEKIPAQISIEERMACGVGACSCCAVKIKSKRIVSESADNYMAGYALACTDGPVFSAEEFIDE